MKFIQKLWSEIKHYYLQGRQNVAYILLFALMFSYMGRAIPSLYFRHFDTTQYFIVREARIVTKNAKPCGDVEMIFSRKAVITVPAEVYVELSLINNSTNEEIDQFKRDILLQEGDETILITYTIPCNAKPGTYFYRADTKYFIRGNEKHTPWQSTTFEVTK